MYLTCSFIYIVCSLLIIRVECIHFVLSHRAHALSSVYLLLFSVIRTRGSTHFHWFVLVHLLSLIRLCSPIVMCFRSFVWFALAHYLSGYCLLIHCNWIVLVDSLSFFRTLSFIVILLYSVILYQFRTRSSVAVVLYSRIQ